MGLISFLKIFIVNIAILILFITFMPGLLPDVPIVKSYKIIKAALDGKLTPNNKLNNVEVLFKGELLGPESLTDDKNYIYVSLQTGDIVKISGKHIVPVVQFGKPCKGIYEERICGRPLGLRFGSDGYLYAADAYYGIFRVDVNTGDKKKLVSFGQEIEGKPTKLPNSVTISCNGDVYWTDSTSNFILQDGVYAFLDDPAGRLIHYNAKTGENKVLMEDGLFTNGLALSTNEDFVIVADGRNQILRHFIKGPKTGTTDIFVRLPGVPDNIQTDGKSGFLISVIVESNLENPNLISTLSQFPNIRRFLARSLSLSEFGFRFIDKLYPNEICQRTTHFIGHISAVVNAIPSRSVILHVSENGEILDTLWTNNRTIQGFSEAHIVKNYLYLGSPFNDYLGRIPLAEVGWEHLSKKSDSLTSTKQICEAHKPATKATSPKITTKDTPPKPTIYKTATTATPPKPTITAKTHTSTTATPPKPTTTAAPPKPTTTSPPPKPSTTSPPPKPSTTNAPPKATVTTSKPTTTPKPTTTTKQTAKPPSLKQSKTPAPITTQQTTTKPTTTQKPLTVETTSKLKTTTTTPKPTSTIRNKDKNEYRGNQNDNVNSNKKKTTSNLPKSEL